MRPPKSVGWRIDPAVVERIREAAEERGLGMAWLVERLLTEGLDRLTPAAEFRLTRPDPPVERPNPTMHR